MTDQTTMPDLDDEDSCPSGVCHTLEPCYCDTDPEDDDHCPYCGGTGERIPDHCCDCGGGEYDCTCCGKCGGTVEICACPITVQLADGTTKEV